MEAKKLEALQWQLQFEFKTHRSSSYLSVEEYFRVCPLINSMVKSWGFSQSHTIANT